MAMHGFAISVNLPRVNAGANVITDTILPLVFSMAAVISVLFIVVGALRYIASNGEPNATKQAKDTIMYAVIGLVIALSALAISNFIFSRLT